MNSIVTPFVALGLAGALGSAFAASPATPEFGNVISSTPVTVQVTVPRQQCVDQPGVVQAPTTGGGAIVGGILGGLAGNAIGAGAGRAVATGIGAIAGAVAGNGIEAVNTAPVPVTTTNCVYSRSAESRVVGYDVVYEFNGQRYTTRTARDPGARIALDIRPSGETRDDTIAMDNLARSSADPYGAPPPSAAAYPSYPVQYIDAPPPYPYPPYGYGSAWVGYPAPFFIEGRFGGRGRR